VSIDAALVSAILIGRIALELTYAPVAIKYFDRCVVGVFGKEIVRQRAGPRVVTRFKDDELRDLADVACEEALVLAHGPVSSGSAESVS